MTARRAELDPIGGNVRRLAAATLAGFVLLGAATFYWGFLRADELAARPDNPRRTAFDRRIQRGRLLDRHGQVLAETTFDDDVPTRRYPVPAAAPVTGFQTWRYAVRADGGVSYGLGGAEAAFDPALRGDLGLTMRQLIAAKVLHRPQVGHDVRLTIDAALQADAAAALAGPQGAREGVVVVVDVASGAVRALVSWPTFDPEALDAGQTPEDDPRRPLFNRATQGRYPPGSTWKAVTLAAALAEDLTTLDEVVEDGDRTEHFGGFAVRCNNNPDGVVAFDIAHAFGYSCNVTFARLGAQLGATRYRDYAARFGLGAAPPFALPIAAGSLSVDDALEPPELASAAFGQGEIITTPLHMALVAAALAGDGRLPTPYLLEEVVGITGETAGPRGPWREAVSPEVADRVREAMVVSARDGWARTAARAAGTTTVGGKTGTAQLATGAPHSWFVGFAPAEAPQLAVAVLVVHGGEGAQVAAPIGGRVLDRALALEREGTR